MKLSRSQLAQKIDHTLLAANASEKAIQELCAVAIANQLFSVCVNPCRVGLASECVGGSDVRVCSVIGFPLGAHTTAIKVSETEQALRDGATEIDMVLNIGWLCDGSFPTVTEDIASVRKAIGTTGLLKVIIEAALLTDQQKESAALCALDGGAEFVKTSTGMNPAGGATLADVRLLRRVVGSRAQIKASGGIRDLPTAMAMVEAGADRLGTSGSVMIVSALLE